MKNNTEIRVARNSDIDEIVALERRVWEEIPASKKMISERLSSFPEGNFVAVDTEKKVIVGYLCLMFVDYEVDEFPNSWNEITANGTTSNHNPNGKYMYGVTLTVDKGYSVGMELQVYGGWGTLIGYRRRGCYLGSPIPGFAKYRRDHPGTKVEDYVFGRTKRGRPIDPELAYYESAGFKAKRILPEYEKDSKSLNYGVLVYVPNVFYYFPCRQFFARLVRKFGFKLLKRLGV